MARITSYDTLQTEVKSWIRNVNTPDADVEGWIQLAESRFKRVFANFSNELTITTVPSSDLEAIPTGYNGLREAYVQGSPNDPLILITPAQMTALGNLQGVPLYISIQAGNIKFSPSASGSTVVLTYIKQLVELSDSNTDNYLLLEYPDVYLGGVLAVAQKMLRDDQDAVFYINAADVWESEMEKQSNRRRSSSQVRQLGAPPVVGNLR